MTSPSMLEVDQLRKTYGDFTAVDGISFRAGAGQIFGLLGPNGAGKTTTIGCIAGLLTPTSGNVRVMKHDVVKDGVAARQAIGFVPQEIALYDDLSAEENLAYWGGAQGMRNPALRTRIQEVLDMIGLLDRSKEPVKRFSGGMKRRLNFGCGIVHHPKLLLLDEPTVGVDPQSRVRLLELVRAQAAEGTCVLYTTHYMEEAEALCDHLAIVDHGHIIAQGALSELKAQVGERDILRFSGTFVPAQVRESLAAIEGLEVLQAETTALVVTLVHASRRLPAVYAALESPSCEIRDTTLAQPSLESLFIKLTGKQLRE
jgi:ABC-2 type transport system ATP-binding protein